MVLRESCNSTKIELNTVSFEFQLGMCFHQLTDAYFNLNYNFVFSVSYLI